MINILYYSSCCSFKAQKNLIALIVLVGELIRTQSYGAKLLYTNDNRLAKSTTLYFKSSRMITWIYCADSY